MQLTEVVFSNVVQPEGKDAPLNFKRRIRSAFICAMNVIGSVKMNG